MNNVATLPADERAELFRETAARRAVAFQIVEKDFWVCWTLKQLFDLPDVGTHLIFKGGTSLSKIYDAIERFSEDIDVSIARDYLGFGGEDDPENAGGTSKRNKQLKSLTEACIEKIENDVLPALTAACTEILGEPKEDDFIANWSLQIDESDPQTLLFAYPKNEFSRGVGGADYVKPIVRIEMGARSDHFPAEVFSITPYAAEEFPIYFTEPKHPIKVLAAERTFWEKATILHEQSHQPDEKGTGDRISRHYYDLYKLQEKEIAGTALADLELLKRVVKHKKTFFAKASAQYDECLTGNLRLVPSEARKKLLAQDYGKMGDMFFGNVPGFEEILKSLEKLETEINERVSDYEFEEE